MTKQLDDTASSKADVPAVPNQNSADTNIGARQKGTNPKRMNIPELLEKAKCSPGNLGNDDIAILHERFVSMDLLERRRYYTCGESFLIPEEIPTWQDDNKHFRVFSTVEDTETEADSVLNQKVALWYGDITKLEVDCVVNATDMVIQTQRRGVGASVSNAAGPLLGAALKCMDSVRVGQCAVTAGYQLPAKYLLHTSGPAVDYKDLAWKTNLSNCYKSCLDMMKKLGQKTVAFPCISAGAKGMPKDACADVALKTVRYWILQGNNKNKVDKIIFSVFDQENMDLYRRRMFSYFPPAESDTHSPAPSLPVEILRMDSRSVELYKTALEEGKEKVYTIRVMIIGHFAVGKTTLTQRLLGRHVDINVRKSTNGIDVHVNKCKVSLDNKKWISLQQDQKSESPLKRLARMVSRQDSNVKNVTRQQKSDEFIFHQKTDGSEVCGNVIDSFTFTPSSLPELSIEDNEVQTGRTDSPFKTEDEDGDDTQCNKELMALVEEMKKNGLLDSADHVDVSMWDFAGQYVFYTTHQMFLSPRVVYLLVTDISKHIGDVVIDDDCFFDCSGSKKCNISEFIDFWMNSIHSYVPASTNNSPSVILVGTHADKISEVPAGSQENRDGNRQKMADAYFEAVRHHLSDKPTRFHLVDKDFDIDNTVMDPKLEELKEKILQVAQSQRYWGEEIPARWLPLEKALRELTDKGLKVVDRSYIEELNNIMTVPITNFEELELFLKFQHELGNIIYFSEESLRDKVVLDSVWLLDALKSLITAKMFCMKRPDVMNRWEEFSKKGILQPELLDAIWQKEINPSFHDNRNHLLALMEKLNIISRPRLWLTDENIQMELDYFLAPCMLQDQPPANLLTPTEKEDCSSSTILVFNFVRKLIPTALFHRLLSACLAKWPLWQQGRKDMLFCGCGAFRINQTHKLTMILKDYTIQIWVTKFSNKEKCPETALCGEVRKFIQDSLKRITGCLTPSVQYVVGIKCPKSSLDLVDAILKETELETADEVVCTCNGSTHVVESKKMLKYWSATSSLEKAPTKNLQTYQEQIKAQLPPSVLHRRPTDQELGRISKRIGREFQLLGIELGVPQSTIDVIRMENPVHIPNQILRILQTWRDAPKNKATFSCLLKAMNVVGIDTMSVFDNLFD